MNYNFREVQNEQVHFVLLLACTTFVQNFLCYDY